MPIKVRLTLWYVGLLAITLVVFGGVLYAALERSFRNEVDRAIAERARQYAGSVQVTVAAKARSAPGAPEVDLPPIDIFAAPDVYVALFLRDGTVVSKSSSLGEANLPLFRAALEAADAGQAYVGTLPVASGSNLRLYSEPVRFRGETVAVVEVAQSLAGVEGRLRQLALVIALGISGALIVALVVGAWLAHRALAPVDNVTRAALHISRAEDLSQRLDNGQPPDEIGRLVSAFNEMLGRLDDVFRDQQRFVADVSHELRTPLTALQGTIHLLKRGAIRDPTEQQEALLTIESEVARLNRLVSDLLLLARADAGREEIERRPVELDTILLEVYIQGKHLAQASGRPVKFRLGHEDQATVLGDPDRLKQLLLNLVDNAIKYTPEGEVVLSLFRGDPSGWVRLVVQDTGIGIPEESLPLLFRRFYRVDRARSRELGGSGLGLAIAEWIADAHGGRIEVESTEGLGSTFTIYLPLLARLPDLFPTNGGNGVADQRGPAAMELNGRGVEAPIRDTLETPAARG
ncbi:MAG TPA: HAMP domain-containing sensor histidine kinase [Ardenticatenaceae bacterium]|nr:HAMP domain-containing sensor histidine kinase [Ardenticatenaceae bacterium]